MSQVCSIFSQRLKLFPRSEFEQAVRQQSLRCSRSFGRRTPSAHSGRNCCSEMRRQLVFGAPCSEETLVASSRACRCSEKYLMSVL